MLSASLFLAALVTAPPQAAHDVPMSVAALVEHHAALTGKIVEVEGRLVTCGRLSCMLRDEAATSWKDARWVSFADAPAFDAAVAGAEGHRVIVEGVVLDQCWDVRLFCTDRAPQFRPFRLVRDLDSK